MHLKPEKVEPNDQAVMEGGGGRRGREMSLQRHRKKTERTQLKAASPYNSIIASEK